MRHVPVAFITAKDSHNIKQLINLAQSIFKQARERVSTGQLNRVLQEAIKDNPPHIAKNRAPKCFFATQVAVQPPTIVVKVNDVELFSPSWERYLLGRFREDLPFKEVPIRLYLRGKTKEDGDDE
jgi:GTP-binding protein